MSGYLDAQSRAESELEVVTLPLVAADEGNVEAARFRVGLAMVCTMLADAGNEHGGALPSAALHGIASDIIEGNDRGIAFVGGHVSRMMAVRFSQEPTHDEEEGDA